MTYISISISNIIIIVIIFMALGYSTCAYSKDVVTPHHTPHDNRRRSHSVASCRCASVREDLVAQHMCGSAREHLMALGYSPCA